MRSVRNKLLWALRYANAVFSPGRGLAGFPQEKLKWRIKTKKMRPLGRRGKLRVKRNASPVLDLIRIFLSAKFSEKFIYESKNVRLKEKNSCGFTL